jgi:hypothetical protein
MLWVQDLANRYVESSLWVVPWEVDSLAFTPYNREVLRRSWNGNFKLFQVNREAHHNNKLKVVLFSSTLLFIVAACWNHENVQSPCSYFLSVMWIERSHRRQTSTSEPKFQLESIWMCLQRNFDTNCFEGTDGQWRSVMENISLVLVSRFPPIFSNIN